jgi:CDP-diacylglycerol---serine O-phosphatidyltransferase
MRTTLFPPFEPDRPTRRRRFRPIPVRTLVPNLITLLALCAGLTAIRLAVEGRLEIALGAIVFAAVLDGVDGRVARMLKGTSRFGAELDSLADFVNFGVAPALILYFWDLHELQSAGWIAAMVFAICAALRLARFNVMIDDPNRPLWAGNFFTGVPAPAGALLALIPLVVSFEIETAWPRHALVVGAVLVVVGGLMVSRLPTFSFKKGRVPRHLVLPSLLAVALVLGVIASSPWIGLSLLGLGYASLIPFSWIAYRRQATQDRQAAAAGEVVALHAVDSGPSPRD